MSVLVLTGVGLRILVWVAYKPALMFFGDSFAYIVAAQRFQPPTDRPFGYPFFLRVISSVGGMGTVTMVQHLLGIAMAIALYVVLMRRGVRRWLGALVCTPLLLDAYLLQIEHEILSETLFAALILGAVLVAMRQPLTARWALLAGGLLAAASITRTVALPIAVAFIGYLLARRVGWRVVTALVVAIAAPVLSYMTWFASYYGNFATSNGSGQFLYGRVAVFADCAKVQLTDPERQLCDNAAPSVRPNANFYVWSADSPLRATGLSPQLTDQLAASFAKKIILAQPVTYATYAARDVAHYFAPGRFTTSVDSPLGAWLFPTTFADPVASSSVAHNDLQGDPVRPRIAQQPASLLRAYQDIAYTQGPLLLLAFVVGLASGWLVRGTRRWDGPFAAVTGLLVLAVPSLTVMFDYRYGLPALPVLMLAGAIGVQALIDRRSKEPTAHHTHARVKRPAWAAPAALLVAVFALLSAAAQSPLVRNTSFETYVASGAELGRLGPPLDRARAVEDVPGVRQQSFVAGAIVSAENGGIVVPERYLAGIARAGGLKALGSPVGGELRTNYDSGLRYITFNQGVVFWSRLGGSRAVVGDIYTLWGQTKIRARLRDPLAWPVRAGDGSVSQRFRYGSVRIAPNGSSVITVDRNAPKAAS